MSWMIISLPLLLIVGFLIFLIVRNRNTSGIKFMLLGIAIILVGGIIADDPNSNLTGFEYFIILIG